MHHQDVQTSITYPAWLLGYNPSEQIVIVTVSKMMVECHSYKLGKLLSSHSYKMMFPNVKVETKKDGCITTTNGGKCMIFTPNMSTTGFGFQFLIVDDQLIEAHRGDNKRTRDKVNCYFRNLMCSQNQSNAVIIQAATRLHERDLTGFLLSTTEGWKHVRLPAIAEEDEEIICRGVVFRRRKGELLSPKRLSADFYAEQRKAMGEYGFAGQYQQRPVPLGGGELKREWVQYYNGVWKYDTHKVYICVDPASGMHRDKGDYTTMFVIGLGCDENIYVHDIVWDKYNLENRIDMLFQLHKKYQPILVAYEEYGMQSDIECIQEKGKLQNYDINIKSVGGRLAKEDRIRRLIPYFESNRIWFPRTLHRTDSSGITHDLVHDFIEEEMLAFPVGLHDDMLDCLSRIFDVFNDNVLIFPSFVQ